MKRYITWKYPRKLITANRDKWLNKIHIRFDRICNVRDADSEWSMLQSNDLIKLYPMLESASFRKNGYFNLEC